MELLNVKDLDNYLSTFQQNEDGAFQVGFIMRIVTESANMKAASEKVMSLSNDPTNFNALQVKMRRTFKQYKKFRGYNLKSESHRKYVIRFLSALFTVPALRPPELLPFGASCPGLSMAAAPHLPPLSSSVAHNKLKDLNSLFIAVHAGAGTHSKDNEAVYKAVCKAACLEAITLLKERKSALESVTAAVSILEDAECTNAGVGSNLTMEGKVECDASVMDGKSLLFGAVGALSGVKNPVQVANKLVEDQKLGPLPLGRVRPSILVGTGAQDFCKTCNIGTNSNMLSEHSFKTYNRYKRKYQMAELSLSQQKETKSKLENAPNGLSGDRTDCVQDTVGAVCVDLEGNVAAASSSGGIWLKHPGRLGPAALYGAGCWAQNQVSSSKAGVASVTSGCGEHLIQTLLAKTCCDAVRSSQDFSGSLATVFQKDFLDSEFLRNTDSKFGGVLILKTQSDGSGREVELSWIHSTATMCVGYMDGSKNSPHVFVSRIDNSATSGSSYTMGGHMISCETQSDCMEESSEIESH